MEECSPDTCKNPAESWEPHWQCASNINTVSVLPFLSTQRTWDIEI